MASIVQNNNDENANTTLGTLTNNEDRTVNVAYNLSARGGIVTN